MKPFATSPAYRLPEASKARPIGPTRPPKVTKPVAKLVAAKPDAVVKAIANSTPIAAQTNSETANHTALFLVILSTPVLKLEDKDCATIAPRAPGDVELAPWLTTRDRKSTRLNSSHSSISYA